VTSNNCANEPIVVFADESNFAKTLSASGLMCAIETENLQLKRELVTLLGLEPETWEPRSVASSCECEVTP
jgi:hypothetical protein